MGTIFEKVSFILNTIITKKNVNIFFFLLFICLVLVDLIWLFKYTIKIGNFDEVLENSNVKDSSLKDILYNNFEQNLGSTTGFELSSHNIINWKIILYLLVRGLLVIIPVLIGVAYLILAERKILAKIQKRKGPNTVGILGILQPLADGLKLLLKESIIPNSANKLIFIISPIFTFYLSLLGWIVIPLSSTSVLANIEASMLYIFVISSLGVYGIIMSGWSSNSRYAFLGACRSAAQMISYEISLGLILIHVILLVGSANIYEIVMFQEDLPLICPLLPSCILFFICSIAETNRPPFDLPEAEAELVSGYNVEFSSMAFALFSLAEYANILLMSVLITTIFLGGWFSPAVYLFNFVEILQEINTIFSSYTQLLFIKYAYNLTDKAILPAFLFFPIKSILSLYVHMNFSLIKILIIFYFIYYLFSTLVYIPIKLTFYKMLYPITNYSRNFLSKKFCL